ncbi:MAG: hypothetical protein EP348_11375 [Alphaproteobacteria bacterium]|nr:MAG: hypothetical protein EP348_11375 [Alphaproteobacteria bacterium]
MIVNNNSLAASYFAKAFSGGAPGGNGNTVPAPAFSAENGTTAPGRPVTGGMPLTAWGTPALLGNLDILSGISCETPDGKGLSMVRFDATNGANIPGFTQKSDPAHPTDFERMQDHEMYRAFMELASHLNFTPDAKDIHLQGTAAVDIEI